MDISVLIVEDDEHIRSTAKAFFENAGYHADACYDGEAALQMFYDRDYQLVILDIMLPFMNGLEILREIRKISDVPALFITALDDDAHQLRAFAHNADDYITKPFSMQILLTRAEAILRRSGILKEELCLGALSLFPSSYAAFYNKRDMQLTPREFEILLLLAQSNGGIISRERLLIKLWGYDFEGNERIVDSHIKNLRSKLPTDMIKTVKGIGYRLEATP